jgi:hypothetical protein
MSALSNPDKLVEFVIDAHKRLGDGEPLVAAVASLGMTSEQARVVVGTVRDAYGRSVLLTAGMKAAQFRGDYETDSISQAALKQFLAAKGRAPSSVESPAPKGKPWWKFWGK